MILYDFLLFRGRKDESRIGENSVIPSDLRSRRGSPSLGGYAHTAEAA